MAAVPIWQDVTVNLGAYASIEFRITADGIVIYTGKAYRSPGASNIYVRINEICADYLSHSLPSFTDRTFTAFNLPSFVVQRKPSSSWSTVQTVQFYPDWSYDYGFSSNIISAPINGHLDSRMTVLTSRKEITADVSASYKNQSGTTTTRTCTITTKPNNGTCAFYASAVANTAQITVNSQVYKVVTDCGRYALYYVNAYGGWDQFLIEGNDLEADNLERYLREIVYDNTSAVNAGKENYVSEVTKSWTFYTGSLSDSQAGRMHHLLNSPLVYLQELSTNLVLPVIITTNTAEYKTYKNNGRKMVNYSFSVELAQNRIRR